MKLKVIDRKDKCIFGDNRMERYSLLVITEENGNSFCGYEIGFSKDREDYDKIVEIVNNQQSLREEI